METKAEDIIKAFDECREYVFGYAWGRDNPHSSDKGTATEWLTKGLTFVVAVMVFYEQMNWMHEKFLRYGNAKERSYLPASLKVFNDNIETAIRRSKDGGQVDQMDKVMSSWRSRCKAWFKNPALWRVEMWGPEPFKEGSRVPQLILNEFAAAKPQLEAAE